MPASAIAIYQLKTGAYENAVYSYAKGHSQNLIYLTLSRTTDIKGVYLTNVVNDITFYYGESDPDRALLEEFPRLKSTNAKLSLPRATQ